MLEELSIRNFALVDSLTLSFENGFNVLTGETGAGKSIIVGSLSFLLGAKSAEDVIRTGCEEAGVSAVLEIKDNNRDALDWLLAREIEREDSRVIVRRNIKTNGRGSIFIQNIPVSRNDLSEFMALLFDLHGQHSHETLLRKETHRRYLDRFAGLEDEALAFNKVFLDLAEKRKTLEASISSERDRDSRMEILNYGVDEISRAGPKAGESAELEAEAKRLGDFEKLSNYVNTAASVFFDDDASLLSLARGTRSALESAASIDTDLGTTAKRMEGLFFEIEDLAGEFRSYRDRLTYDPQRLETVEERLSLLFKLKKKYLPKKALGLSPEDDILAWKQEAESEIEYLASIEENRDKLKAQISILEKDLLTKAAQLSAKRKEGALRLGQGITIILSRLGMPNARFSAAVTSKVSDKANPGAKSESLVCGPWGTDDVEFMISANKGEPLKELARIASGGELSRVMLAIKTILSSTGDSDSSPETLIFDEIDTGIGGEVAISVGEYLAQIGKHKQIFCVTHLATIAVRCDNHFKVEKKLIPGQKNETERTISSVSCLEGGERRQEIARMLAGDDGKAALAHADELLAKYKQG
jgi:DNA repair protein RecN (Recombination protein N)